MRTLVHRSAVGENFRLALDSLRANKARSALTSLGVFIAVIVLVLVFSIMYGVDAQMRGFIEDYGTDTLYVFKFEPGFRFRLSQEERMRKPITLEDAGAILRECPSVRDIAVQVFFADFTGRLSFIPVAKHGGREAYNINFQGANPAWERVQNAKIESGRFFTEAENLHRKNVVVIGNDLSQALFPAENAVGQSILVDGFEYAVVGVLEPRKALFMRDPHSDREFLVPYNTYRKHRPQDKENFLTALVYPGKIAQAEDEITGLLRQRRGDAFGKPDSFSVSSGKAIMEQFRSIMGAVSLLTVLIASIGMLVGGVGVMNIMLMAVTERTHEIGLRKATGARRREIIQQFLTEAVMITSAGGVCAVVFSLGVISIVKSIAPGIPAAFPMWAVLGAVAASMCVGLFFGVYPAMKASRLDPVEALRYE